MKHLAIAALVAMSMVFPSPVHAAAPVAQDPATAVQRLLDTQTQTLRDGNKTAYLATIDPQAAQAFKDAQAKLFDGMRSIPLVELQLRVRLDDSGDLAPGLKLAGKHKANAAYLPETRRSYRIDGYEDRPSVNSLYVTYVERDGSWYAAADTDAELVGLDTDREIWDSGPMATQSTAHFLVITTADQRDRGAALGAIGEDAYATFARRWSKPWSGRMPLIVPPTAEAARVVLHTDADIDNFSAFTVYVPYRDESGWHTTAPRLYAQEANLAGVSRQMQVETMVHELTHAASASLSGPFTPIWQHEGLAEWIRLNKPNRVAPPAGVPVAIPTNESFTTGNATSLRNAYGLSTSATANLARSHGVNAPIDLLVAIGNRRTVPGSSSYNINSAFQEVTTKSLDEFAAAWAVSK